ncbi:MAG: sensor N-terminal transmembrane domain-containing protein [Acetobacteraceae bacterium]|nr:sensor N-terminal transmembrane domain-containing protein [Acetobacteraceae bacterium]
MAQRAAEAVPARRRSVGEQRISPLTRRILLVNALPLFLLVAGILYTDRYQEGLLDAEAASLTTQAQVFAGAIAETAVRAEDPDRPQLIPEVARPLLRRLTEPTPLAQSKLFGADGALVADSRVREGPGGAIVTEPLPPPPPARALGESTLVHLYDLLFGALTRDGPPPSLEEGAEWAPDIRPNLPQALAGDAPPMVRRTADNRLVVSVAAPVQRGRRAAGVVQVTREAREVGAALFDVRMTILGLFASALVLTVGLSFYLSSTIARPVLRLARAAERMREGKGRQGRVQPDILARGDEIGELAARLDESAQALWARIDAIERFAADVAHEIKNPLTSIRSAIETLRRIENPDQQRRLLAIIAEDVVRLDRLISDISDASRVDAELSRTPTEPVDIAHLLETLAEIHNSTREDDDPVIRVERGPGRLHAAAVEGRIVQVFRNLIANAVGFSPPRGVIRLSAHEDQAMIRVAVEDSGPGIPPAKIESIFDRFYSERPHGERFGQHSGLGLSISRQIVEALRGSISAENRQGDDGAVIGARFVVRLPKA